MVSEFHILKRITTENFQPIMALTKPLMPVWIFMLEAFGRDRDLHFSMFGCVTQRRLLKRLDSQADLQETWELEEEAVCGKSNKDRTGIVLSPSFHD